jgi:hypothetical protein
MDEEELCTSLRVNKFEISITDFDRARNFYTEALGFQSWDADYPLPMTTKLCFSKSAVLIANFATSAICAPFTQSDSLEISEPETSLGSDASDGIQIVPRIFSAGQITVQYHAAENTATAALGRARNLNAAFHGAPYCCQASTDERLLFTSMAIRA